jgi:hypothetical protein
VVGVSVSCELAVPSLGYMNRLRRGPAAAWPDPAGNHACGAPRVYRRPRQPALAIVKVCVRCRADSLRGTMGSSACNTSVRVRGEVRGSSEVRPVRGDAHG